VAAHAEGAVRALAAAIVCSAALVGAYVALGGGDYEPTPPPDPCAASAQQGGDGLTGTLERVGLNALAGAACDLGVSRERLLLALSGERRVGVDDERREEAFRTGLRQAVGEEEQAGRLGGTQAFLVRAAIEALPVDAILDRLFGEGGF
jgi:hypothetical protein